MSPHYIIDGYNLIHKIPKFRNAIDVSLENARDLLISFLRGYLSNKKLKVTLVFDGDHVGIIDKRNQSTARLKIIYSKSPEKADPIIKRLLKGFQYKRSVTLVSADNELINYYSINYAKTMTPEDFYHLASKHPMQDQIEHKYDKDISKSELDEWMKLFGEDDRE